MKQNLVPPTTTTTTIIVINIIIIFISSYLLPTGSLFIQSMTLAFHPSATILRMLFQKTSDVSSSSLDNPLRERREVSTSARRSVVGCRPEEEGSARAL